MTNRRAELLLLTVAVTAAAGWIMSKAALQEFEPYTFMGLRFLLAALALGIFCVPDLLRLSGNQVFRCLATGSALGCGLMSWVVALHMTDKVGEGAFIVSLAVVAVPIIGRLFFGDKITPILLLSLLPAVAGLFFLSRHNMAQASGVVFETPQLLFLLSTLAFATHLNLSSHFVKHIPALALSSLQLAMVGAIAVVGAWWIDPPLAEQGGGAISSGAWVLLVASALIATSFRFVLQTQALQQLKPSHASMILLAEPILTAILSVWWLNERMSGQQIIGCALIFAGLLVYRGAPLLKNKRFI